MKRSVLIVVTLTFWAYYALTLYADLRAEEPFGARLRVTAAGLNVSAVLPGSAADRSGLRAGDVLTTVDGHEARGGLVWTNAITRRLPGQAIPLLVRRGDETTAVSLRFGARVPWYWTSTQGAILLVERFIQLVSLIAATLIALRSPSAASPIGAWFLATIGAFSIAMPPGLAGFWSALPPLAAVPLMLAHVSVVSVGGILFVFCATFLGARWRRTTVLLAALPWLAIGAWELLFLRRLLYAPEDLPSGDYAVPAIVAVNVAYVAIGLGVLWWNYQRIVDVNDRRRVRMVVAGTILGTACGAPAIVSLWLGGAGGPAVFFDPPVLLQLAYTAFLVVPVCLWWAIARHQLFDIAFVVRRSLQYMLARQALLVMTPVVIVLVILEMVTHDRDSVAAVVHRHGALYAGLTLLFVVVGRKRATWLDGLDRRFFRDRYDACQVLRAVADRARCTKDFWTAAGFVVEAAAEALHPDWIAVLVRDDDDYKVCAGDIPRRDGWPCTLSLLTFVQAVGRPVEIDTSASSWLQRHVAESELAFFERLDVRLIVPILSKDGSLDAVIVLGGKKSEEPFSREDKNLLMGIAETLSDLEATSTSVFREPQEEDPAIDTEGSRALWAMAEAMVRGDAPDWSQAERDMSDDEKRYVRELRFLRDLAAPVVDGEEENGRVAAVSNEETPNDERRAPVIRRWGTFELSECIGSGGVGSVWRARDHLEREVAVKLLRDDGRDGGQLLEEAKRLARIRHRHVVHVYGADRFDGVPGLWMEMVAGDTLAEVVRAQGPRGAEEVVAIGRTLCSALAAVHGVGLIHQDVKAQNVMRERGEHAGRYVLMDLGAGVSAADVASPRWGTPGYCAPEVLFGGSASVEGDIYSLGALLFFLVTGELPVPGDTVDDVRRAHRRAERRWLQDLRPNLPVKFIDVVDRALAPEPGHRFSTAGALSRALVLEDL